MAWHARIAGRWSCLDHHPHSARCRAHLRPHWRPRAWHYDVDDDEWLVLCDAGTSALESLYAGELVFEVAMVLGTLTPREKKVVVMRFLEQL
jgi:DNA-directed RNA polymerase specialized sigma24 family protein